MIDIDGSAEVGSADSAEIPRVTVCGFREEGTRTVASAPADVLRRPGSPGLVVAASGAEGATPLSAHPYVASKSPVATMAPEIRKRVVIRSPPAEPVIQ